ncbi:MAG: hypothetical protein FWE88_07745 [Phycisphaerae bacterium]|nr:hypothetical protein [Phycisphaerae bacterium]
MAQSKFTPPPLPDDDGPQGELPEVDPGSITMSEDKAGAITIEEGDVTAPSQVKAIGVRKVIGSTKETFARTPTLTGEGAVRCRIFFSRIAAAPLAYMEQQINDWLDSNQIEVKSVSQVVGVMEGKNPEPNVIITVWY